MAAAVNRLIPFAIPKLHRNWIFALLALAALCVSAGFWWWSYYRTKEAHLTVGSGVELIYRAQLVKILCEEADANALKLDIAQSKSGQKYIRAEEAIDRVNSGELDAAVIPAGLGKDAPNVRQVAMLECEALHLFVKPEILREASPG